MRGNHYETLGVGRYAEEFLRLERAYEVLSNDEKRRRYDEELDRVRLRATGTNACGSYRTATRSGQSARAARGEPCSKFSSAPCAGGRA